MEMISFDERAKEWDSDPDKVKRACVVAEAIRAAVPLKQDMTALEYGCGTGLLSFALQDQFKSITLADTSQGMLDVLAEKISAAGVNNMLPLRLDLATEPPPASRYDIIYSLMTLHHVEDVDTVLKKFFVLLGKSGFLCISDLDAEDGSFHGQHVTGVHHGFERSGLRQRVESAGFRDVRFSDAYSVQREVDGVGKSFPLFLMIAQKG
jgi:ubiquinone/menaquinone biosynthesis C-methylase UbiE